MAAFAPFRAFFAALLFAAAVPAAGAEPELFDLEIINAAGAYAAWSVEVADTPEERRIGLMHRLRLPPDRGMLLAYEEPVGVRIWMKNTYVPLDILFIDESGTITGIAEGEPLSEALIPSAGAVRAVLELNAGQAAAHGITPGARVVFAPQWPGP